MVRSVLVLSAVRERAAYFGQWKNRVMEPWVNRSCERPGWNGWVIGVEPTLKCAGLLPTRCLLHWLAVPLIFSY